MKKLLILSAVILILTPLTAFASPQFDRILSEKLSDIGVYDGNGGIVYADKKNFQGNESLFIAEIKSDGFECQVYDDTDGIQLTDTLLLPLGINSQLSVACADGTDYILFTSHENSKNITKCYTLENDAFFISDVSEFNTKTLIADVKNGRVISRVDSSYVYQFLKQLKEDTVAGYTMSDKLNILPESEIETMKRTVTSCADIMHFDIKDYDYDTLFKYILYTHKNFCLLTDIEPLSGNSSSFGYNNVSLVNSDFIDFVMENVFRITPDKPPVNNLVSRGFCYSNGYYFYTGGFDVYFSTQILDIEGVYDLGGNVYFVVFSDIYNENNVSKPEYSFAVLQKTENGYSLLRLGMGEILPSQSEIYVYSPFSAHHNIKWTHSSDPTASKAPLTENFWLPVLFIVISVGIVGFVCSMIILVKSRK